MKRLFLSLFLCLGLLCGDVFAATKYVSPDGTGDGNSQGSPDTFEDAYAALRATDGDHTIIFIEAGTYNLTATVGGWANAGDDLTLQADTGLTADDVILDANNAFRRIYFSRAGCDLTATNITFQNGVYDASNSGWFHFANGRHIIVSGCKFLNNIVNNVGSCESPCLHVSSNITGNITVTSSIFSNNTTINSDEEGIGGAITVKHPGDLTITDCVFSNNLAGTSAGALHIVNTVGTIFLSGNSWTGNTTERAQGGAIWVYNEGVNVTIDGDIFTDNTCSFFGLIFKALSSSCIASLYFPR